jgi:hypothetical protein
MFKKDSTIFKFIFLVLLTYWTYLTLFNGEVSILHSTNLVFHEAGHTIFVFLGEFAHFLGGTILQIAIPLLLAFSFLRKGDIFATLIMLWWVGENLINVSAYIADARIQQLELIGGEHDWTYILGKMGILQQDLVIAKIVFFFGVFIMVGTLVLNYRMIFHKSN